MQSDAISVIDTFCQENRPQIYNSSVRRFALSVHFHSPRAYRYIRNKFANRLPAPSTIKKWFLFSVDGSSGICNEAMSMLSDLVEEQSIKGEELLCSLSFDEMHIKSHLEWLHSRKVFSGLVTYKETTTEDLPFAKQVIVFMITSVQLKLSLPIAHFFIDDLNATEKVNMLSKIIRCLWAIGVTILNITFDGLRSNRAMCEAFGASFDPFNIKPWIEIDGRKMFVIFDPPHMMKLIRNKLASYGQFHRQGQLIQWKYIERLERQRINNNFVAHKITKEHIQWNKNEMKVKLAAQVFSRSAASALDYLRNEEDVLFTQSEATASFLRIINDLFDIFNSKHPQSSTRLRTGLTQSSAPEIFTVLDEAADYIRSLKIGTRRIVDTGIKCGFVGFLVNIETLRAIYYEYIETEKLNVLLTFYLGQDLLESFFGRVRSKLGNNDNPTAAQFCATFRAILTDTEIVASEHANCVDALNILSIPSTAKPPNSVINVMSSINIETNDTPENDFDELDNDFENENQDPNVPHEDGHEMSTHEIGTVAYFAGQIEKKILNGRFQCEDGICSSIFDSNEKIDGNFFDHNKLTQRPCKSTLSVCEIVHKIFTEQSKSINFNYNLCLEKIKKQIPFDQLFPETDFSHDIGHKVYFINFIIDEYVRLYGTYLAKRFTLDHHKSLSRRSLHKLVHRKNL